MRKLIKREIHLNKEKMVKKLVLISFLSIILLSYFVSSVGQEAIDTEKNLDMATKEMASLLERGIPITRVNESLEEAKQIFSGQLILERTGKKVDYTIVNNLIYKSLEIMENSKIANDELKVFLDTYKEYEKETDLSGMSEKYDEILSSFEEERFEETIELIEEGYTQLSEIQSSQTTVKLFYKATSNGIKTFFTNYWIHLLGLMVIGGGLGLFFKKTVSMMIIKREIKHLEFQKESINHLIGQTQKNYFKNNNISKMEYDIKINKFENMIRDINRQIPLLKESIAKIKKNVRDISKNEKKKIAKDADKKINKAKDLEKEIKGKLKKAEKDLNKKVKENKKRISKKKIPKKTVKKKNSKKKVSRK